MGAESPSVTIVWHSADAEEAKPLTDAVQTAMRAGFTGVLWDEEDGRLIASREVGEWMDVIEFTGVTEARACRVRRSVTDDEPGWAARLDPFRRSSRSAEGTPGDVVAEVLTWDRQRRGSLIVPGFNAAGGLAPGCS